MIARKILPAILITLVVLFGLYLIKKRNAVIPPTNPVTSTKQVAERNTNLSLTPGSVTLKKGEEKKIIVAINSQTNQVTGVQLVLTYDPKVLSVKDIVAGDFMTNPSILFKDIDKTPGQSNFAVGTFKPKNGNGQVAIMTIVGKAPGKSTLTLEGSMVAVSSHETDDLKNTIGATVVVN